MKKLVLLSLLAIFGMAKLQAQKENDTNPQKNILKTDISSIMELRYDLNLQFERSLTKHSSVQLGFIMQDKVWLYRRFGFGFSAAYRYYFSSKKLMKGFYISPSVHFNFGQTPKYEFQNNANGSITYYPNYKQYNSYDYFSAGTNIGYQWHIRKMVIDLNAGYKAHFLKPKTYFTPTIGLKIGYRF